MEIKIQTKNDNQLLKRTEIEGVISFTGATPSYPQAKQSLAAQLKVKEDLIAIQHLYTDFGAPNARFIVRVYETVEQLQKIEPKVKTKKQNTAEEKKTEEKKE